MSGRRAARAIGLAAAVALSPLEAAAVAQAAATLLDRPRRGMRLGPGLRRGARLIGAGAVLLGPCLPR